MQELVERVRAAVERVGQTRRIALGPLTDDFVWDMSHYEGWPDRTLYEGREGSQEFLDGWIAAYDDWTLEIESEHVRPGVVAFVLRQRGQVKGSSLAVEMRFVQVWRFRGDLLARSEIYSDVDEALGSLDDNDV